MTLADIRDGGMAPTKRYGGTSYRVLIDYEHEQCCAEPRKFRLITNGVREWKCGNCGTVRPRE